MSRVVTTRPKLLAAAFNATTSPYFRVGGLKLHSIAEMQARYDEFAAAEFDRVHSGLRGGYIGEDGRVHEDVVPINPYRDKQEVDA
ncbi:MAG TPA: hypothetical protein VF328_15200 [Mycobacterium sp.]